MTSDELAGIADTLQILLVADGAGIDKVPGVLIHGDPPELLLKNLNGSLDSVGDNRAWKRGPTATHQISGKLGQTDDLEGRCWDRVGHSRLLCSFAGSHRSRRPPGEWSNDGVWSWRDLFPLLELVRQSIYSEVAGAQLIGEDWIGTEHWRQLGR